MTPKTEQNYVVDTSFNWADEMDVDGCCILSESQIADYKAKLDKYYKKPNEEIEYCCGTNEEVYFKKSKLLRMLNDAKPITPEEEAIIRKFMPSGCLNADIFYQIFWDCDEEDD